MTLNPTHKEFSVVTQVDGKSQEISTDEPREASSESQMKVTRTSKETDSSSTVRIPTSNAIKDNNKEVIVPLHTQPFTTSSKPQNPSFSDKDNTFDSTPRMIKNTPGSKVSTIVHVESVDDSSTLNEDCNEVDSSDDESFLKRTSYTAENRQLSKEAEAPTEYGPRNVTDSDGHQKRPFALLSPSDSNEHPTKKLRNEVMDTAIVVTTSKSSDQKTHISHPEQYDKSISSDYVIDPTETKQSPMNSDPPSLDTDIEQDKRNSKGDVDNIELPEFDPVFAELVNLEPIPESEPLEKLSPKEVAQLESLLQIGENYDGDDNCWRGDWNGNLQFFDKEILMNKDQVSVDPSLKPIYLPFYEWISKTAQNVDDFYSIELLFRYIYHMSGTPPMAKRILSYYLQKDTTSVEEKTGFILEAVKRISYDPIVLVQDGWTTAKADNPDVDSGGAYLIGRRVIWHRSEAIIIAFVRDEEIGDLWKAIWLDDTDTFDLEADELQEAIKRWDQRQLRKAKKAIASEAPVVDTLDASSKTRTNRKARSEEKVKIVVEGIEEGIILAVPPRVKGAIPWPARIMHASEIKAMKNQGGSRRTSSRNEISVIFLAPYWNCNVTKNRLDFLPENSDSRKDMYSTGPFFEIESIEVSEESIIEYHYSISNEMISIDELRAAFDILDVPKGAFTRYLDSHRMATALKLFARKNRAKSCGTAVSEEESYTAAYASLTDTHPFSIKTFLFPNALLNLPFEYILSNLKDSSEYATDLRNDLSNDVTEPIINLHEIMEAIKPPRCWGKQSLIGGTSITGTNENIKQTIALSAERKPSVASENHSVDEIESNYYFANPAFIESIGGSSIEDIAPELLTVHKQFVELVSSLNGTLKGSELLENKKAKVESLKNIAKRCLMLKGHGEDLLFSSTMDSVRLQNTINIWRKTCEKVFKTAVDSIGNGITFVLTDSRCNQHLTGSGSFERPVRLPAAIQGAKKAGFGSNEQMILITHVEDKYLECAEQSILPKAHSTRYLKKMKERISAIPLDKKGLPLTDDSEGEGGEDTMGSRGTYLAAVVGVAAALKGVDMIVCGESVNGFCAVRPPGHHAGRTLRPMNAISNGFCVFNAAACAALYAVSPISEGGLGLRRVCVIDIDVHHGNGTQDILCSTKDPRFLYVSTHAGGPHINGYEEDVTNGVRRSLTTNKNEAIFPGRCGDSSPHNGVLNIPLGRKVTPTSLGTALASQVLPTVTNFAPDLIIISAGFDAHKNDPLGMGGLTAEDYGTVTTLLCHMARKCCSGRILSILEGGYGVPCCRPFQSDNLFLPDALKTQLAEMKVLNLGGSIPQDMEDGMDSDLFQKLDVCHQEGFMECVQEHTIALSKQNDLTKSNP